MSTAVLIPAYNPDGKLLTLLSELISGGFDNIVVVDDGSKAECQALFDEVAAMEKVVLHRHPVNMGKGAALKSGLICILNNFPECRMVITADADGQHTPQDICRLSSAAGSAPEKLWLGVRAFDKDVPLRSLIGNRLTAFFMRILLGMKISDTQTGLRAIPRSFIRELLQIPYNRYEFELEMLLACKRSGRETAELTISTVYIDNNSSSHFNPLKDSFKIYIVLFRYILVSLLTAVVDYLVYVPALFLCGTFLPYSEAVTTAAAVSIGRIAGAAVQYTLVRKVVFYSRASVISTLPKFIFLVICSGCASYLVMHAINSSVHWNFYFAKLAAELIIYLANFLIQRDFIFQREER
ncbi:MAG: bifunctional glycosyltransferase family 2/GtrA family protein [Lentisphaeria bacterium]|nr:bifunctional glycosyltransferase family 2/GtrA family protein [Lentisphaeria bacterium]